MDSETLNKYKQEGRVPSETQVFVQGLPKDIKVEEIYELFVKAGSIRFHSQTKAPKIHIYKDKISGLPLGECTVTFGNHDDQKNAMTLLHHSIYKNQKINVTPSIVKPHMAQEDVSVRRNKFPTRGGGGRGHERGRGRGGRARGRGGGDQRRPRENGFGGRRSPRPLSRGRGGPMTGSGRPRDAGRVGVKRSIPDDDLGKRKQPRRDEGRFERSSYESRSDPRDRDPYRHERVPTHYRSPQTNGRDSDLRFPLAKREDSHWRDRGDFSSRDAGWSRPREPTGDTFPRRSTSESFESSGQYMNHRFFDYEHKQNNVSRSPHDYRPTVEPHRSSSTRIEIDFSHQSRNPSREGNASSYPDQSSYYNRY